MNGGSPKQGESWKDGMDLSTASPLDISQRAEETLLRCYTDAMRKRRVVLQTILTSCLEFEHALGKGETSELQIEARHAILKTIGTLFEGRVMQGLRYSGLAKRKHMTVHLEEATKDITTTFPGSKLEEYAHSVVIGYCKDGSKWGARRPSPAIGLAHPVWRDCVSSRWCFSGGAWRMPPESVLGTLRRSCLGARWCRYLL